MSENRAVVVDPEAAGRLVIRPVAEPAPGRNEAIVRVDQINRCARVDEKGHSGSDQQPGSRTAPA